MPQHTLAISRSHLLLFAVLAALAAAAFATLGGTPTASAATTCGQMDLPGNGYITSISVTNVSCTTGKRVARSYADCRLEKGKTARCTRMVRGYSCRETKRTRIPTEINARVRCTLRSRSVVHTYQQNL